MILYIYRIHQASKKKTKKRSERRQQAKSGHAAQRTELILYEIKEKEMDGKKKTNMLLGLVFLFLMLLLAATTVPEIKVRADESVVIQEFASIEEAVYWLEKRGLPAKLAINNGDVQNIEVLDECNFPTLSRNPAHNYPLNQNTPEVIVFLTSWCAAENRIYMVPGSDWWGWQQKQQRLWGLITIRFAENDLLDTVFAFDITNTPDVSIESLFENIFRQFELGSGQRRITFEGNVEMEGALPATKILETLITPEYGSAVVEKRDQDGNLVPGITFDFYKLEDEWVFLTKIITDQNGKATLNNLAEGVKYRGLENLDSLPNGSKPLENSEFEFEVNSNHPNFSITVVNMIPKNLFLPVVYKQVLPETPLCPRQGEITYYPYGGGKITAVLEFNFGTAKEQSIPVLQDGTILSIRMVDNNTVKIATLRWAIRSDPTKWVGYSDLPPGPSWNFYTKTIGGELNIHNLYWFSAYYEVPGGICVTGLLFQFDP